MRVYDIINAGPKNRFMANGKIVSNSGKLVQLQNLAQNHLNDLDEARKLIKEGDLETIEMLYDSAPSVLSQCIRTAFVPKPGYTFAVADFSAIEARVIAWLADEQWRIDLFARGGDIYCQSASRMFNCEVVKHGINGHLRARGKVAELACLGHDSLVLTNQGLVPIQDVTVDMRLWDGQEWVTHEGAIYKGERDVISYQGLTATPDHRVYTEEYINAVGLEYAAEHGLHLVRTGNHRKAIRLHEDYIGYHGTNCMERHKGKVRVYDIRNAGPNHRFTVSDVLVHNCGYGGSVGAMVNMGAVKLGLTEEECLDIVTRWREASPHIVNLWWEVDDKVKRVLKYGTVEKLKHGIEMWKTKNLLHIKLPSGRCLRYYRPKIVSGKFGREVVEYQGYDTGKWSWSQSYGPKFVEGLCQSIARDCLIESMKRVAKRYPDIVMHVHDEMIVEVPKEEAQEALDFICSEMGRPIDWAPGLLLRGDGYLCDFYKKD